MGLEIVGSRVLAPVFGTSLFVWGALITTFLAALAAGYALGGRLADRRPEAALLSGILLAAGALAVLLFAAPDAVLSAASGAPVPDRFRALLAAIVLFGPPSVLMGAVTPFAVRLAAKDLALVGSAAGRLSAISTAGSILGAFATAFFLIPTFPTRPILFGLGASLLLAAVLVPARRPLGALPLRGFVGARSASSSSSVRDLKPPARPAGTILFEKETAYHRIARRGSGSATRPLLRQPIAGLRACPSRRRARVDYTDGLALSLASCAEGPRASS